MRAVALEAGVSLGLVNYHYHDKAGLIAAALRRIGEQDLTLLTVDGDFGGWAQAQKKWTGFETLQMGQGALQWMSKWIGQ